VAQLATVQFTARHQSNFSKCEAEQFGVKLHYSGVCHTFGFYDLCTAGPGKTLALLSHRKTTALDGSQFLEAAIGIAAAKANKVRKPDLYAKRCKRPLSAPHCQILQVQPSRDDVHLGLRAVISA
jgi:hypothetical protein